MANPMPQMLLQLLGQQQALGALGPAYEKAVKRFDTNYYDPYSKATEGAAGMLANSYGLGGAEGNQAARDAFTVGPGYQFAQDQGLDAINRTAASRGMLSSGNNTQDLLKYSQGLANQEFGNWQKGLGDLSQLGLSAAGGQTGRQGALANLDYGYGKGQADIISNTFSNMNDIYGNSQKQQQGGLGNAIAGGLNLGGAILGGLGGGPGGAAAGGNLGNFLGQFLRRG